MERKSRFIAIYLLLLLFFISSSLQAQDNSDVQSHNRKQGIFYISPFYEYTQFKELELTSHTNHYKMYEGNGDYTFTDEQIQRYNYDFGTEYRNSLFGLKIGYQVLDGFGINVYAGVNHFNFKSWVSDENTQTHSNELPELTLGISSDYQKNIYENLTAALNLNFNYSNSGSAVIDNNSGEEVVSADLIAMFWEIDLAVSYSFNNFVPFAGIGYTEQYINAVHTERIISSGNNGEGDFYDTIEFDANFNGNSFYGFAGLEYSFNQNLSMYVKSSFMNPLRANLGLIIIL